MLDSIVSDEANDYGCICEIDLRQQGKINKILSRLLYPPKDKADTNVTQTVVTSPAGAETAEMAPSNTKFVEKEETKGPPKQISISVHGYETELEEKKVQQQMIVTSGTD